MCIDRWLMRQAIRQVAASARHEAKAAQGLLLEGIRNGSAAALRQGAIHARNAAASFLVLARLSGNSDFYVVATQLDAAAAGAEATVARIEQRERGESQAAWMDDVMRLDPEIRRQLSDVGGVLRSGII